jgi:GMP synthase (glutamine-hydrolysing)
MSKSIVAICHLAFEDLGVFQPALENAGFSIRYVDVGLDNLLDLEGTDPELLIVLGGPIGAYEEETYPFLLDELRIFEQRIASGRPLMGICLGAQLIARALGSRVYTGPQKEIGFAPLSLTEAGQLSCLSAFGGQSVLHWHGDTFDLPSGATHLASTNLCVNQAFAYDRNVVGFQFHPEIGSRGFERWLIGHAGELSATGIRIVELRKEHERLSKNLEMRSVQCINSWLDQIERDGDLP